MKYFEFGQEHPELMVMLHGGGVCYRGALPVAEGMAAFVLLYKLFDKLPAVRNIPNKIIVPERK